MPIAAIAIAAVADFAVAGTVGGLIAGTAALTVGSAMAIVGAVGATVAAVGAVTGNKTLSTVGMVLGGIGAVGGLASAAGIFDAADVANAAEAPAAADVAAADAANPTAAAGAAFEAPGAVTSAALPDIAGATNSTNTFDSFAGGVTGAPVGAANAEDLIPSGFASGENFGTPAQDSIAKTNIASGSSTDANASIIPGQNAPPPALSAANPSPSFPATNPTTGNPWQVGDTFTTANGKSLTMGVSGFAPTQTGGLLASLSHGDNLGLLAMGGVQTLGSLVAGATNPLTPAQIQAMNAQAAQNQAAANLQSQQNVNMGQPIPTATRTQLPNVTGAPAGIINSPGTTSTIVGKPA